MVYKHNGILFRNIKEPIWVNSNEVDEPRAYYTEWSQKEDRYCILTHIYGICKILLAGSKGDTDIKNKLLDTEGEGEDGMVWRIALKHIHYHM